MTDLVIGSGPAGVSVAIALLNRGRQVLMIDGGQGLEASARERRDRMAASDPEDWSAADIQAWQAPQLDTPPGQVRRFGSDFAMVPGTQTLVAPDRIGLRASHAAGGLSNLWGSAVLPNRDADITDWPLSAQDLAPHYRAVAKFLPVSGREDALQALFPAFPMQNRVPLTPSPQAGHILHRLEQQQTSLAGLGTSAGNGAPGCGSGLPLLRSVSAWLPLGPYLFGQTDT